MTDTSEDKEACRMCKFMRFRMIGMNYERTVKECRKNPPSYKGWPKVQLDDWCSQFEEDKS